MSIKFKSEKAIYVDFSELFPKLNKMMIYDDVNVLQGLGELIYEHIKDEIYDALDSDLKYVVLMNVKEFKNKVEKIIRYYESSCDDEESLKLVKEAKRQSKILLDRLPMSFYIRIREI